MNKNLNIVFLDFDDIKNPLLAAGQARATFEVGSRLVKKGHTVTVLSSKYPKCKDRKENGLYYKHIGIGSSNIRLNNLVYILTLPFYVRKIKNADIIIECFTAPISTLFTPLFTKIPVIALPSMLDADRFSKKYHLPFNLIERFGIKFYKYFLPYSDIDSAKIKSLNSNAIYKIVPQGVGKEFFKIEHKKPKYILFLGRFDISQKGIDLLLKSYSKVMNIIGYPLVLAGHGPDDTRIKDLIKSLNLEDKVKVVGAAYGNKKFKLISNALFVVFPSRQDECSLWAIEALASGLPLVSFDLPETKWADKNVNLKARPFDIEEFASLMIKATDKKVNHNMRVNARHLARKYTWEKVANEFMNFMNEIVRKEKYKIV